MTKKILFILGAGQDQLFMIRTAQKLGLQTVVVDVNPNAPGLTVSDYHALISTRDIDMLLKFVDNFRNTKGEIHGVSTMGSDIPHIVTALASHLKTPCISEMSARLATNKYEMKERFRAEGVKTPWYTLAHSVDDVHRAFTEIGGPFVIKPLDQAGSKGVSLISNEDQADFLFAHAMANTAKPHVLLESFITGPQISTESLMIDGEIYTPGFADRNYDDLNQFLPQIIENGGWVPSLFESQKSVIENEIKKAALALGITNGVVKGDVVLSPEGPAIIEIAARLSGGDFSESLVPLGYGINYAEAVIKMALGENPDLELLIPKFSRVVANRYFFAPPGILQKIEGIDKIRKKPWIAKFDLWYKEGDLLPSIRSHGQRTGVFVVTGSNRTVVQERIDYVYKTLRFTVSTSSQ